jgi:hypothetical protein
MEVKLDLDCKQTARRDINFKQDMYINKYIAGMCNTHKLGYQKANTKKRQKISLLPRDCYWLTIRIHSTNWICENVTVR